MEKRILKEHKTEFKPRWWLFLGCSCPLYRPKQITPSQYAAGRASGSQISELVCWFSSIIRSWPDFQVHPPLPINFSVSTVTILTHALSCFLSILASVIPVLSFKPSSKSHLYFRTYKHSFQTILIILNNSLALPSNYNLCNIDINSMDEDSVFARVQSHVQWIRHVLAMIPELDQKMEEKAEKLLPCFQMSRKLPAHQGSRLILIWKNMFLYTVMVVFSVSHGINWH